MENIFNLIWALCTTLSLLHPVGPLSNSSHSCYAVAQKYSAISLPKTPSKAQNPVAVAKP